MWKNAYYIMFALVLVSMFIHSISLAQTDKDHPNILLIIADDLGVDVSNGYHQGALMPTTPTLDSLRANGVLFENVFSAPKCTPSRANIMSGKYGVKTGVTGTPGNLDLIHNSIFTKIADQTNNLYADAVIGKWHISHPSDPLHPTAHGVDYYLGLLGASVDDYYAWQKTENGVTATDSNYVTSVLTDAAIDWVQAQNQPWFLWLAHAAPHSPIHEPPSHMYTISPTGNNFRKYLAMIESIDYETNRLLASIPDSVRENTLIIYIGDNGTPNNVLRDYPAGHGKSTLYQGGIRVPMLVSGAGVTRNNERESALVHITDIYATILEATGATLDGGVFNSLSFHHLLNNKTGPSRAYNYTELDESGVYGFAMRDARYKLIEYDDGRQEFYDLLLDSFEVNDLFTGALTTEQDSIKADLETEAEQQRLYWSCRDFIKNGDEEGIDCGGSYCDDCMSSTYITESATPLFTLGPNPASTTFTVYSEMDEIKKISVLDTYGTVLYSTNDVRLTQATIDISAFSPQLLFIEIHSDSAIQPLKLIKQ